MQLDRNDIIRMAEKFGLKWDIYKAGFFVTDECASGGEVLERLANFVAKAATEGMVTVGHMGEQIAAERKACEHAATVAISLCDDPVAAIRARGQ